MIQGFISVTVNGVLVREGRNQILNAYYEFLHRALVGRDTLLAFQLANQPDGVVTAGMGALRGVVATVAIATSGDNGPSIAVDSAGLRSIGVYRATFSPVAPISYNMQGLVTTSGLLVAAKAITPVSLSAGDVVGLEWRLAGRGVP